MSMISELVEELIDNADLYTKELHDLMYRAANTIVMLSEKAREPTIEPTIVKKYDTFCGVPMAEAVEVMQRYKAEKTEPQTEETEMERLERIDNDLEDAWARIRELTDEPQTCSFSDCDNFKNPDYARCIECKRKQYKAMWKTEPQTDEEYINNLPWTEVGNGEQTDCAWK